MLINILILKSKIRKLGLFALLSLAVSINANAGLLKWNMNVVGSGVNIILGINIGTVDLNHFETVGFSAFELWAEVEEEGDYTLDYGWMGAGVGLGAAYIDQFKNDETDRLYSFPLIQFPWLGQTTIKEAQVGDKIGFRLGYDFFGHQSLGVNCGTFMVNQNNFTGNITGPSPTPVPEPKSLLLFGLSLLLLSSNHLKKNNNNNNNKKYTWM